VREELVSTVDLMPTVLAACGAAPVPGLPGGPLQPLLAGEPVVWRTHLFTEYHTHAAATNYHPQRAVRTDRYKLIENLLPDTVNPDYADTFRKLEADAAGRGQADFQGGLSRSVDIAAPEVRAAYALMEKPPRYELHDLQADPYEFRNLADSPDHAAALGELRQALADWRAETKDPLLDPANLERLTAEVTAVQSKAAGKKSGWGYPDYFFGREPAVKRDASSASEKPAKKRMRKKPVE
jgi:N-sulfoglucosamine sulfohydrolase